MKIGVDFSSPAERSRVPYIWLGLSAILFVFCLATYLRTRGTADSLNADLVAAKYELSDAQQRKDEVLRITSGETTEAKLRADYRAALPWVEVLDALESLSPIRVTQINFDVDGGTAAMEILGSEHDEPLWIQQLQAALPHWRIAVARQTYTDGHVAISLRLEDTGRPPGALRQRRN